VGQLLTRHTRPLAIAAAIVALAGSATGCRRTADQAQPPHSAPSAPARPTPGGEIVALLRAEPQSFNWLSRHDASTYLLTTLTQARLVRVNRATDALEPWLADSWVASPDGLKYTLKLRSGVTFADGAPFTADDVAFSFAAAYDEPGGSILADSMKVAGKPLTVAARGADSVDITFPAPFGPGLRLLDNLPILPRHKLKDALAAHRIGEAWGLATPLRDLTGLGPFVLSEYAPGQRLVFSKNARYFRRAADGTPLPYLDRITVELVPDQDAQLLRLTAGAADTTVAEVRPEDYAPLKKAAVDGKLQVLDLGASLDADSLWFNLKAGAFAGDPRAAWIQREELRHAISLAVDRTAVVDSVFLGAATRIFGPVTPANQTWFTNEIPMTPHDPVEAKRLLASIGLEDRNGDGQLEDPRGTPAAFAILTQKGQTAYERGAAVIRDELKKIGLRVDVVTLDGNAVVQRFASAKGYDAIYFRLLNSDTDPALNSDLWLSGGGAHLWNLGGQPTAWEREIDALMARQMTTLDANERKRIFADVQKIFAAHEPMLFFAAPRIFVAASARMTNLTPAVSRPQLLWAADTIAVTGR
jgi:peptide/nickel transport system substrate-binding protein